MTGTESNEPAVCRACGGTNCLTQRGILAVYLKPLWWAVVVIVAGLVLAVVRGRGWLFVAGLGYVLPLAMADLRLLLYPWVALGTLLGRRANCPRCEPSGGVWRH